MIPFLNRVFRQEFSDCAVLVSRAHIVQSSRGIIKATPELPLFVRAARLLVQPDAAEGVIIHVTA